jgi:hypothetical protein
MTVTISPREAREALRLPPAPDGGRGRLRALAGVGQLGYGVVKLRRTGSGWYHVALGARQVVQARLDARGAFSPAADAAIDGIHVASMLGMAAVRPSRRRKALLGAANAAGWALLDAALTHTPRPGKRRAAGPLGPCGRVRRTRA